MMSVLMLITLITNRTQLMLVRRISVQPCDSFVISENTDEWMTMWDDYKFQAIKDRKWKDSGRVKQLSVELT